MPLVLPGFHWKSATETVTTISCDIPGRRADDGFIRQLVVAGDTEGNFFFRTVPASQQKRDDVTTPH